MTNMAIKRIQAKYEREAPGLDRETVPGMVVALTIKRAKEASDGRH